jgi:hypothetical protein
MAPLFPLAVGKTAEFIRIGRTLRGDEFQFRESFRVRAEETIQVGDIAAPSWVVDRVSQGLGNNTFRGEETFWIDKASGVYLRRVLVSSQGLTQSRPFSVTELQRRN